MFNNIIKNCNMMGRPSIKTVLNNNGFTVKNYETNISKTKSNTITTNSGVYGLFYGTTLQYVGQASNLQQRIEQHIANSNFQFGSIDWFDIHYTQIEKAEELLISYYNPPYNKQKR